MATVKEEIKNALLEIEEETWESYLKEHVTWKSKWAEWKKRCDEKRKTSKELGHERMYEAPPSPPLRPASIFHRLRKGEAKLDEIMEGSGGFPPMYPYATGPGLPMSLLEGLRQPLYDTEIMHAKNTKNEKQFFQRQLGQRMDGAPEGDCKTSAETNIQQPGQLANPVEFDLMAFAVMYGELALEEDIKALKETGVFTFLYTGNRVYEQVPLSMIPSCPQLPHRLWPEDRADMLDKAKDRDKAREEALIQMEKRDHGAYEYFVGEKMLRIRPTESFQGRIEWPNGAPKLKQDVRITFVMDGLMYIPL